MWNNHKDAPNQMDQGLRKKWARLKAAYAILSEEGRKVLYLIGHTFKLRVVLSSKEASFLNNEAQIENEI